MKSHLKQLVEAAGGSDSVEVLDLSGRDLTQVPVLIKEFRGLKRLDLSKNKLSSLPEWLCELRSLVVLRLEHNSLCEIPPTLGRLSNLEELSLSENHYQQYYQPVCLWVATEEIQLCTLPKELLNLNSLRRLDGGERNEEESLQNFFDRVGYRVI